MNGNYRDAIAHLASLITTDRRVEMAFDIAAKYDDGVAFNPLSVNPIERALWYAINSAVEAAGEEAYVVVDEAVEIAG